MQKIDLKNKTIFVTDSAGFIGSNLVLEFLRTQAPINIVGLDKMNDYYDVSIKEWRLTEIEKCAAEHPAIYLLKVKPIQIVLENQTYLGRIFIWHQLSIDRIVPKDLMDSYLVLSTPSLSL